MTLFNSKNYSSKQIHTQSTWTEPYRYELLERISRAQTGSPGRISKIQRTAAGRIVQYHCV